MSRLAIVHDPVFKRHDTGFGHPERPARLDAVGAALEWSGVLPGALRIEPRPIAFEDLVRLHDSAYIRRVEQACQESRDHLDEADCIICPETYQTALRAAGAVADAARAVARGDAHAGFCAVRPPGHHAERDRAMGFCLFGNIALAADVVRREFNYQRVLILDWDVHHGNGTQSLFYADAGVLFISLHGHPAHLYPGTGYAQEIGVGAGEGYTMNIPLMPEAGDADIEDAFNRQVIPRVRAYKPEFVLLSAGFDAHADDPLGILRISDDGFVWMARRVIDLARQFAGGRILSVLEGGYNLETLRRCVAEHIHVLESAG
ncbi:MAG: histone deacetylase [Planctomycetes bacterium]|nr:histone deacetylase [Planctomycetota bacterium]